MKKFYFNFFSRFTNGGEPGSVESVLNVLSFENIENVEHREDNILEVACCRRLFLEKSLESKYEKNIK